MISRLLPKYRKGFTLIQLSILLTVSALVLVTALPGIQSNVNANTLTQKKMNKVLEALRQYEIVNSKLPCPADPTLSTSNVNYGVAAAATNKCMGGTPALPALEVDATHHIAMGMVPFKTLGLSAEYALDGYARDITYSMDTNAGGCWNGSTVSGAINITDNGTVNTSTAILVSHGANGYGAWLPGGARLNSGSADVDERTNAHVDSSFASTNGSSGFASFIKKQPTNTFDDIVVYKNPLWSVNKVSASGSGAVAGHYCYKRTITINSIGSYSGTDLASFPMYFNITGDAHLKTTANDATNGRVISNNGYDIIFTSDAAGNNLLNFEQESYDPVNGTLNYWIQIPALSHSGITPIYMFYSNPSTTTFQGNPTQAWDANYMAVYHMNQNAGNTTVLDSTSNNNTGTSVRNTNVISSNSPLGKGFLFHTIWSTWDYIDIPNSASLGIGNSLNFTISTWLYATSYSGNDHPTIFCKGGSSNWDYLMTINGDETGGLWGWWGFGTGNGQGIGDPGPYGTMAVTGTWFYFTVTRTTSGGTTTTTVYKNGVYVLSTTTAAFAAAPATNTHLWIGGVPGIGNEKWYGYMDEFRISNTNRSTGWLLTEYNNQNNPSGFYTVGSETSNY
jgi:hypothetical protein